MTKTFWSQDRRIWAELAKVAESHRWKKVPMVDRRADSVPKRPGIYMICTPPPECTPTQFNPVASLYFPLYVGMVGVERQTGLRGRFVEHCRTPNPRLKAQFKLLGRGIDFWYTRLDNPEEIALLEALVKECLDPPCNSIKTPHQGVLIARIAYVRKIGERIPKETQ